MMAETGTGRSDGLCWCLRRMGGSPDVLLLPEGEEVSLGRGFGVSYQLVSTISPLMISRIHCIFKQNVEGQWTVTDNKSLNGVTLNKEPLEPQKPYVLTKGSCIQVGVVLPDAEKAEFEYEFVEEHLEQIRPLLIPLQSGKRKLTKSKRKLNCEDSEASGTEGTPSVSKPKIPRPLRDENESNKSYKAEVSKQPTIKVESEVEPDNSIDVASTQTPSQSTFHLSQMRRSIVELRNLNAQVQEKLKTPQPSGSTGSQSSLSSQQALQDLQKELSCKHEEHLQRVDELKKIFQVEQGNQGSSSQAEERHLKEQHLKEQLAQALKEHSLLMEDLNRSHQDFKEIIEAKNKELQETKEEKEKMEAQKEEVLNHMNDVLDNELQCSICSEHFIEAVTLNCAHSFCSYCIQSWRKRKEECPICRQEIKSQTRSLVLDNCIDRMVDKLNLEMKDRRLALILERKELATQPIPIPDPSDSEFSPIRSEFSVTSSSEDIDDPLEAEEDFMSDSDDFPLFFSDDELDSDDQGDLHSADDQGDLHSIDEDYLLFGDMGDPYSDDDNEDYDNLLFM